MSISKGHHALDRPSDHCPRLTAFIYGEHCDDLSMGESIGTWTAFILLLIALILSLVYAIYRLLPYILPQYLAPTPISLPTSSKLHGGDLRTHRLHSNFLRGGALPSWTNSFKPGYNLKFRITAWTWGGMAQYTKLLKSEDAHWRVKEQVKNHPDGWKSIEIGIIPGWNCPEARERERVAREEAERNMPAAREEGAPRRGRVWGAWTAGLIGTAAPELGTVIGNGQRNVSPNRLGMPMQDMPPHREGSAGEGFVCQGSPHEGSQEGSGRGGSFHEVDLGGGRDRRGFPREGLGRGGTERGGYLVDISSDEESEKEGEAESLGMGSSNSRESKKQNLSWRKRDNSSKY